MGKLAGAMLASLSQAVYLLNAPIAQAARLAGALQAKAEQDSTTSQVVPVRRPPPRRPAPEAADEAEAPADEATEDGSRRVRGCRGGGHRRL